MYKNILKLLGSGVGAGIVAKTAIDNQKRVADEFEQRFITKLVEEAAQTISAIDHEKRAHGKLESEPLESVFAITREKRVREHAGQENKQGSMESTKPRF